MCVLWVFVTGNCVVALAWFAMFGSGLADFRSPKQQGILQVCCPGLVVGSAELSERLSSVFARPRSMGWRK